MGVEEIVIPYNCQKNCPRYQGKKACLKSRAGKGVQ